MNWEYSTEGELVSEILEKKEARAKEMGEAIRLRAALNDAIVLIEHLAEQQAMADDWYVPQLERLKELAS